MPQNVYWSQLADSLISDRCQWSKAKEERDLGILITDEMKWSKQCNSAAAKAVCARHDQKNFKHSQQRNVSHIVLYTH